MLEDIGLFDERFFAYYEDVDISFRARLAGWKVAYNPQSIAYHHVSATSSALGSFSHFHSNKNFYFLYLKNMPGGLFWKYLPSFAYQAARSFASSMLKGRILSYFKAILYIFIYLPPVLIDRFRIQKNRRVKTADIDALLHHGKPPISPTL
jgi:GT2 family glycosyltransferase